jgi:hypothetical protein
LTPRGEKPISRYIPAVGQVSGLTFPGNSLEQITKTTLRKEESRDCRFESCRARQNHAFEDFAVLAAGSLPQSNLANVADRTDATLPQIDHLIAGHRGEVISEEGLECHRWCRSGHARRHLLEPALTLFRRVLHLQNPETGIR